MKCDFCNSTDLTEIYQVPDSKYEMHVLVCSNCGLVQSIKTNDDPAAKRKIRASCDADWGNIRHGKGLRLTQLKPLLAELIDWPLIKDLIDIGSNRGDFIHWVKKIAPSVNIDAIEPDVLIVESYSKLNNVSVYQNKFEDYEVQDNKYDLVYCVHTLEHVNSASKMLTKIYNCLKDGGTLILDVPNIELLKYEYNIEEFFIDKHTFHFNKELLISFIELIGLSVLVDHSTQFNITLIIKKQSNHIINRILNQSDKKLTDYNISLIKDYLKILRTNRDNLQSVAKAIQVLAFRQKIAIWGAGRIFDALVKYGNLIISNNVVLIDEYLHKYLDNVHEIKLNSPDILKSYQPQTVIVLARDSSSEIESKVRKYGIKNVIRYEDLFLTKNND